MTSQLTAFAIGLLIASCLQKLPHIAFVLLLIPLAFAVYLFPKIYFKVLLVFFCGFFWGVFCGQRALDNIFPAGLVGQDVVVRGRIIDLPQLDGRRQRFVLKINHAENMAGENLTNVFSSHVQLSWYALKPELITGQLWQMQVRLKTPRGFMNPQGFDYEAWLVRRNIGAVGYVRNSQENQLLGAPQKNDLGYWRWSLRTWLLSKNSNPERGVLLALLIGDRSLITSNQWQLLQQTGTNHLIAISGLHIGFVALLGLLCGGFIGRLINLLCYRFPPLLLACIMATAFALFYSALAGFSLPTQRALIMVLVAQYTYFRRQTFRPLDGLLLAFVLVLIADPLAAYDMGFWLSFGAVGVLLIAFVGRIPTAVRNVPGRNLLYSQWVIFVGLLVPLAILVNTTSLFAPLANIVAIPLVTFVVAPSLLVASASHQVMPLLGEVLLDVAGYGVHFLFWLLRQLVALGEGHANPIVAFHPRALVLAALGLLLILLPRAIPARWLGYPALLVALFIPAKSSVPLRITVMDVGQGLAVVVQTMHHVLVYDAGPSYGEDFDAGEGILVPYLHSQGLSHLDALIISHNDRDHAGGVKGLMGAMAVDHIWWGEPARTHALAVVQQPNPKHSRSCHDMPSWEWDQVKFRFLTWPISPNTKPNNYSCVLLIDYQGQTILLPGDIDQQVERQLMLQGDLPATLNLLLAAHHGSRTSSSTAFVEYLRPTQVVFSAGYRNQHGHPHPLVVERFAQVGSLTFSTAESGAIEFIWAQGEAVEIVEYRHRQRRYWHQ